MPSSQPQQEKESPYPHSDPLTRFAASCFNIMIIRAFLHCLFRLGRVTIHAWFLAPDCTPAGTAGGSHKDAMTLPPVVGKTGAPKRKSSKGGWTSEEDKVLIDEQKKVGNNWAEISKLLPGRTDEAVRRRWYRLNPGLKLLWSVDEDKVLIDEQKKVGNNWAEISKLLPGRTDEAVRIRWYRLNPGLKLLWSVDEDKVLIDEQKKVGNNWAEISKLLPGRTDDAVRRRWNRLNPGLKQDHIIWSVDEDKVLIDEQKKVGNNWAEISKLLPGRTDDAVRRRWYKLNPGLKQDHIIWSVDEDKVLIDEQKKVGNNWAEISKLRSQPSFARRSAPCPRPRSR